MDKNKLPWLDRWRHALFVERQAVDSLATTVKSNTASILAILAALAIPAVPAIFASAGVYTQTSTWNETLRWAAAIAIGIGVEGAGIFLSILATKTYSAWRKKAATANEVLTIAGAVGLYTLIVVLLIGMSDLSTGLKIVICLIPFLGVTFYLGLGFESELTDRLDEAAAAKRQAKLEREERRTAARTEQPVVLSETGQFQSVRPARTSDTGQRVYAYMDSNPNASVRDAAAALGLPRATAGDHIKKWRDAK